MESIPSKTYPTLTASFVCIVGKTIAITMNYVVAIRNPLQTRLTNLVITVYILNLGESFSFTLP